MKKRVLVLTVGGRPTPLINAINGTHPTPDLLAFVASRSSEDNKLGSEGQIPEILQDTRWSGEHLVASTPYPDRLDEVWNCIDELAKRLGDDAEIIANYTGGTKSMTAALSLYALDAGWRLQLQAGARNDLSHTTDLGQTRLVRLTPFKINSARRSAALLSEHGDHWGAARRLEELIQGEGLPAEEERKLLNELAVHRFRDALEAYNFSAARELLRTYPEPLKEQARGWGAKLANFEQALAWLKDNPEAKPISKLAPALDLIRFLIQTAEDAARVRARYDDAFSRLYRATELGAQVVLRFYYDIKTGDIDLQKLPPEWENQVHKGGNGKYHVGLMQAYQLLHALNHPLGHYFEAKRGTLFDLLQYRNQSWLAHGFSPIDRRTWSEYGQRWIKWLDGALEAAVQAPAGGERAQTSQSV